MVGALLTVLTLSVLQLGLALHIRNTVQDAAAEGARYGALADKRPLRWGAAHHPAHRARHRRRLRAERDRARRAAGWGIRPSPSRCAHASRCSGWSASTERLEVSGHAAVETLD